jgi:ketosteroid isomerase-like protein
MLVHRAVDAMSARDFEAVMSFSASDAVFDTGPLGAIYEGRSAIRGFLEDWIGAYEDYDLEAEEIRDLGAGVTFGVNAQRGRLPNSTGWVQTRITDVVTWAGGLIERQTAYTDIDEARAAAERLAEERG